MVTQQQNSASNPSLTRDEKAVIENQDQETKAESIETTLLEIRAELGELRASMKLLLDQHEPKIQSKKSSQPENEDADPVGTQAVPLSQRIRDLVEDLQDRQSKLKSGSTHRHAWHGVWFGHGDLEVDARSQMMSNVAEMMIGVVELLEHESLQLRRRLSKTLLGFALKLGAVVLLVVGLVWLGWAGFAQLSTMLTPPLAGLISGLLMFILAAGLLWFSERP
jgi:hypothetical protein